MDILISQALAVPEIQAGIFLDRWFSAENHAQLMLVNHQWAAIIRPFLWYHFENSFYPYCTPRYSKLTMARFLENARWIRSMDIQTKEKARWLANVEGKDKRNWMELSLEEKPGGLNEPQDTEESADIMTILKDCNQLRTLNLDCTTDGKRQLFNTLDDESLKNQSVFIFGLPQLRVLYLASVDITDRGLSLLSTYCPKLETLTLKSMFLTLTETTKSSTTTTALEAPTNKSSIGHREWSSLQKLTLGSHSSDNVQDGEDLVGRIVLAQCQQLEELTLRRQSYGFRDDRQFVKGILQGLGPSCIFVRKNLKFVDFHYRSDGEEEDYVLQLLETFKTFPESLMFEICDLQPAVDRILSDPKRLSTLKSIDLTRTSFPGKETFLQVLLNSPQLVYFKLDDRNKIDASVLENTSLDWVCKHLEFFECHIKTTARELDYERYVDPVRQEQFERDQLTVVVEQGRLWCELLFKQLAKLRKLKFLKIDIELPRHIGLDFKVAPEWMYQSLAAAGAVMEAIDIRAFFYTRYGINDNSYTIIPSACVDWCRSTWPGVCMVEYEEKVVKWDALDDIVLHECGFEG